eukprot:CAMPEP_0184350344 /NCGR_PEP_ID=MMETSP1089-20130417/37662_1 /TAXON_ID=38269 ORGANISM="Gloeochaete wittrockiana, Strain SAG46.84" /NCGR_SAMPLE_ID=MMETSP1089 /ASSEMBLY_ACC=CAM_ASM_000445 /LENGTH=305 /DNA_ID=CAMNT_0026683037 /DNA_START=122 /DNA_END=1039 /DNA_ORIENTATION=-
MSFGSRNSFSALVEPVAAPAVAVAAPAASTSSSSSKDAGKDAVKGRRDDNKGGVRGPRREGGARTGAGAGPRKPRGEGAIGTAGELPLAREDRKPRGGDRRDRKPRTEGEGEAPRRGRTFDRHSGTGRNDTEKKQGAGRHNWGKSTDNADGAAATDAKAEGATVEGAAPAAEAKVEVAVEPKEEDKSLTLAEYEKSLKKNAIRPPKPSLGAVETSFGANFSKVPVEEEFLQVKLSAAASSSSSSSSSAPKAKKAKAVPLSIPVGARERRDYGDRPERSGDRSGRPEKNTPKLRGVHVSDSEFPTL